MKFLLILPLLLSTALSTFFIHANVQKDCEESKPLSNGLMNGHFLFLGPKLSKLIKHIQPTTTGAQNVKNPIGTSFWTNFGYPINPRSNPAYQSSRLIPQAPQSTHILITDLKDKLPIIAYREIKPEVGGANIPILMPMYPYGMNTAFKTQVGNKEGANYGRNNLNSVVEENIEEVFSVGNSRHHTGEVIEDETINTMSNIGGQRSYKTHSYPEVTTPFVRKISDQETFGDYPNTRNIVSQNLPLALGHLFNGVTGQPDHYPIHNQLPIPGIGFSPPPVFGHYNKPTLPWMENNSRFPLPGKTSQPYPGSREQYPLLGGATGQYFTAIGINQQYPQHGGALQKYPPLGGANGQFLLQGGAFQRYPSLSGTNDQFFYASGVNEPHFPPRHEQYPPQGGAFGQNPTQTLSYERYSSKPSDYLNTRLKENNPPLNDVSEDSVSVSSRLKENEPKDENVTNVENGAETEEKVIEKGLVAIKAPPAAGVEGITTEVVVEKGLIAIKAPSSGGVEGDVKSEESIHESPANIKDPDNKVPHVAGEDGTKTGEVVEKDLNATEEVTQNSSINLDAPGNEASLDAEVEETKPKVEVEKEVLAIEALSNQEVKGDVKDKDHIQNEPIKIEAADNKQTENAELPKLEKTVNVAEAPLSEVVADNIEADSVTGRLADIEKPFDENLVDAELINGPNKTSATSDKSESYRNDLVAGPIDNPNVTENKPGKEIVEVTESGPKEVDTEIVHISSDNSPAEDGKVIGKEYVSEIAPRPKVSEEKVDRDPGTSHGPIIGRELDKNNSKIQTRDTLSVLEEPQTISFTIHLPPKTITTKVVSQVSEHKTKDGNGVNVVPIQRVETVEQKTGSSGHIEPTVMNGPNGVQITFGSSGNEIYQQGEDSTHVINLGSILGLAQTEAYGNGERNGLNKSR